MSKDVIWSANSRTLRGTPPPVQAESGTVPGDDGLWLDDHEDVTPARPQAAQRRPEQPVPGVQFRPGSLALEYGDLLAQGEDFEGDIAPTPEEDAQCGQQ